MKRHLYALDQDQNAIDNAQNGWHPISKSIKRQLPSFAGTIAEASQEIWNLLRLGSVQSPADQRERFSIKGCATDMRDESGSLVWRAYEVVNHYTIMTCSIFKYGEISFLKWLLRKIEQAREVKTNWDDGVGRDYQVCQPRQELTGQDPAARIFQAIRIEVTMSWVQQMNLSSRLWTCWL